MEYDVYKIIEWDKATLVDRIAGYTGLHRDNSLYDLSHHALVKFYIGLTYQDRAYKAREAQDLSLLT